MLTSVTKPLATTTTITTISKIYRYVLSFSDYEICHPLQPTPTAVSAEPSKVVEALETAAKEEEARVKRERMYRLLPKDILFCTRMIEAHNDDFEVSYKTF
jgi:hypothetical protein